MLLKRTLFILHWVFYGPLTRYAKLRFAHAPGIPGILSQPPTSKEIVSKRSRHASRHMRHAHAVMHVGIANQRWCGKRSRHFRRMRNPKYYVSDKRPMALAFLQDVSRILRYNANYAINGSTPKCTITSSADSNPAIQDVRKPFWPNGDKTCWSLQIQKHEQSVVVWKRRSTTCKCDIISIPWNLSRKTR